MIREVEDICHESDKSMADLGVSQLQWIDEL